MKLTKTILSLLLVLSLTLGCSLSLVGCQESTDTPAEGNTSTPASTPSTPDNTESEEDSQRTSLVNQLTDLYGTFINSGIGNEPNRDYTDAGFQFFFDWSVGEPILKLIEDAYKEQYGTTVDLTSLSANKMFMRLGFNNDRINIWLAKMDGINMSEFDIMGEVNIRDNCIRLVCDLFPEHLEIDLDKWLGINLPFMIPNFSMNSTQLTPIINALPDSNTFSILLTRYLSILSSLQDCIQTSSEAITVEGVTQQCTRYSLHITAADIREIVLELLTAAKSDAELRSAIKDLVAAVADSFNTGTKPDNVYSDFIVTINQILDNLNSNTGADAENYIDISFFCDENENLMGGKVTKCTDGVVSDKLNICITNNAGQFGIMAAIAGVTFSGSGTTADGKASGSFMLNVNDKNYINLKVTDFSGATGTLVITPAEDALSGASGENTSLENLSLQIDLAEDGTNLQIFSGVDMMIQLRLYDARSLGGNALNLNGAGFYDVFDQETMRGWLYRFEDRTNRGNVYYDFLISIGFPDDMLEKMTDSFADALRELSERGPLQSNAT